MSIRIRMVLGPQTAKLRERVLRARELLNREEGEDNAAIMEARALLSRVTLRVEAELQNWEEVINGLQGAEKVAEQDRFTAFLEDVRQIPQLLVDAHAVMDEMEVEIAGEIEEGNSQAGNNPEPQEANYQQARQQGVREAAAHPRIRLPELRMPTFAGEPLEWPAFWQTFESAVHNQGHLAAIDKMNYLIGCLKGKAARAVMGYRGGENYTNMVTTLQRLYGNQQVIAEALQAELFNLPNVEDSAESIQPFTENLERICLQLNALGHPENSLMCMAVKAKLPRQVLTELVRMEREEGLRWQMSDVRRGLAEIVSVREEVQRCSRSLRKEVNRASNSYRQTVQRDQRRQSAERARTFVAVQGSGGRELAPHGKPKIQFLFCNGAHWADECRKVASVQQRTKLLSEQERCFMCLRRGHRAPECRSRRRCAKCNGPHNRVICPRSSKPSKSWNTAPKGFPPKRNQAEVNVATAESVESGVVATAVSDPKRVLLMARRINIFSEKNPVKKMRILAFFDPGSQVTMVKSSVVQALSPQKIKEGLLEVSGFHNEIPVKLDAPQYKLQVALEDGRFENLVAYRADWIVKSIRRAEWSTGKVEAVDEEADLLIGMPEFWKFFKRREQISASLFRIHTSVGPIVCGRDIPLEIGEQRQICAVMSAKADCEMTQAGIDMAKNFWDLQLIGIKDDPKENDDDTAMQIFEKKAKRLQDGRYCAGWPWKEYPPELPSNYNMAYRRLGGLLEKLRKTPELLQKYDDSIRREHELGSFEKGERKEGYPEHFLPHHGVVTHKLRIVFDASAHPRGEKSLNECMFRGPVMIPDLVGILMRFRLPPIALWADLEKAFNAISMDEEDREFVKFLWVKDPEKKPTADNLQVFRWARIPFGVIASPFILAAVVQKHLEDNGSPLAIELAGNAFVDNLMASCQDAEEVMNKYREGKALFAEAQMNLREFICNSTEAMNQIPEKDRLDKQGSKVLGIPWDIQKDELSIGFPEKEDSSPLTKRKSLRALASVFDPLGIAVPCLLHAKLFIQQLWDNTRGWDEELPAVESAEWAEISKSWKTEPLRVPRRAVLQGATLQLHAFVDASKNAYAAVLFARTTSQQGQAKVEILYAKNRLKPRKTEITIPRMELLAMLIGSRMLKFAENQLRTPISGKFIWGDSKSVLGWIASKEVQPRFVENRLREIRKISDNVRFVYVATQENPADIASRGCAPEELRAHHLWWHGPPWLVEDEKSWPMEMEVRPAAEDSDEQEVTQAIDYSVVAPIATEEATPWIDPTRFSSWSKLRRTVVWILRAVNIMRNRTKSKKLGKPPITNEEYEKAELLLLKLAQKNWTLWKQQRIEMIKTSEGEDGLIRLTTRLARSAASEEMVKPVVLPEDCPITRLIIHSIHESLAHAGVEATLTEFLGKFWTPRARTTTKRVIKACGRCRRMQSPAFKLPTMPPYPDDRVKRTAPFESIGIDYLGPTNTKVNGEVRKAWIALFTCLSTRAIYLEPVLDLTAASFLQILRRFASRRGNPKRIITDNGTQFVLAAKVAAAMEAGKPPTCPLEEHLAREGIRWRFTPSLRPWSNGFLERQVAGVKAAFKRVLGRRILPMDELSTFVAEVEATLNQRPLTYVDEGPEGVLPLRPIDFLMPRAKASFAFGADERKQVTDPDFGEVPDIHRQLQARWRSTLSMLDEFWARWNKEYLLMLRNRLQWDHKGPRSTLAEQPQVGDVVIIEEEKMPRNCWPLGRITELQGSEKAVRSAKLRIPKANGEKIKWREISRPVNRLYRLEVPEKQTQYGTEERDEVERDVEDPARGEKPDVTQDRTGEEEQSQERGARPKRQTAGRQHGMVTRAMAKVTSTVGFVALSLIFWAILSEARALPRPPEIPRLHRGRGFPQCQECELECIRKGVELSVPRKVEKFEVCCGETRSCLVHRYTPDKLIYELPRDQLIIDYQCGATFWTRDGKASTRKVECQPQDACALIECCLCVERLANPECRPDVAIGLYGLMTFAGLIGMCWMLTIIRQVMSNGWWLVRILVVTPIRMVFRVAGRQWRTETGGVRTAGNPVRLSPKKVTPKRAKSLARVGMGLLAMATIAWSIESTAGTAQVVSISAVEENCKRRENGSECRIESSTDVTLLPAGQPVRLILRDPEERVLGVVEMTMKSLSITCIPRTEKWLRSYTVRVTSVKSCPREGSCVGKFCRRVHGDSMAGRSTVVEELKEVQEAPGFTGCREACSFWNCGCALPTASCIFFRPHAVPASGKTYELISCPTWEYRIGTKFKAESGGNFAGETEVILRPGMTFRWKKLSITPVAVSQAPAPIRFTLLEMLNTVISKCPIFMANTIILEICHIFLSYFHTCHNFAIFRDF